MGYAEWLQTQGPSWILDPNGKALAKTTGAAYDVERDRILQAVLKRFPTAGQLDTDPASATFGQLLIAPDDALEQIGDDRMLRRGVGETSASYAARLLGAWDTWPLAGSHYGILRALALAGYVDPIIVQDNGRWSRLTGSTGTIADLTIGSLMGCKNRSAHPGWFFDYVTTFYSRFGIVFEADASNLQTLSGQAILNEIVSEWGPERIFVGTWVALAGGKLLGWPLSRVLGGGETLGGNSVRFIPGDGSPATVTGP
jgi:hypothetical protein